MKDKRLKYAAIAVKRGQNATYSYLAVDGKVVVFDTAINACDFAPMLGGGRTYHWNADLRCFFSPLRLDSYNEVVVIVDYDPYNTSPNNPARSEAHGLEWKHHIHWGQVWRAIKDMCQQAESEIENQLMLRSLEGAS